MLQFVDEEHAYGKLIHKEYAFQDKYILGDKLASGSFGTVHLCTDRTTLEQLACKCISKQRHSMHLRQVHREVVILSHLSHSNVVKFIEAFEDGKAIYLVMEFCEGGELFDQVARKIDACGRYTEEEAAPLIKIIVKIIQVCHSQNIVHGDIKLENFLIKNGELKLIDFGGSKFFNTNNTTSNWIVYTPSYAAPEVLKGQYGHEADIWSAGVILYILLSGRQPFHGMDEYTLKNKVVQCKLDVKREPWPGISNRARQLVRGMLEPDPALRLTISKILDHPWFKKFSHQE